jgi:hypothetical protein
MHSAAATQFAPGSRKLREGRRPLQSLHLLSAMRQVSGVSLQPGRSNTSLRMWLPVRVHAPARGASSPRRERRRCPKSATRMRERADGVGIPWQKEDGPPSRFVTTIRARRPGTPVASAPNRRGGRQSRSSEGVGGVYSKKRPMEANSRHDGSGGVRTSRIPWWWASERIEHERRARSVTAT